MSRVLIKVTKAYLARGTSRTHLLSVSWTQHAEDRSMPAFPLDFTAEVLDLGFANDKNLGQTFDLYVECATSDNGKEIRDYLKGQVFLTQYKIDTAHSTLRVNGHANISYEQKVVRDMSPEKVQFT